ncbi:hypothetical protein KC678_03295 [Candidatus Dojkabacteria bacterium]|uniref:Uncharacterized protein n=1 Tax=Candidatus Dojkabacteria bacterium TaxID=2099670 RepID=A0A955L1Q5_9BACT|nr:hypothetical protein [Candidatus Dojkabacteria bacterium]
MGLLDNSDNSSPDSLDFSPSQSDQPRNLIKHLNTIPEDIKPGTQIELFKGILIPKAYSSVKRFASFDIGTGQVLVNVSTTNGQEITSISYKHQRTGDMQNLNKSLDQMNNMINEYFEVGEPAES